MENKESLGSILDSGDQYDQTSLPNTGGDTWVAAQEMERQRLATQEETPFWEMVGMARETNTILGAEKHFHGEDFAPDVDWVNKNDFEAVNMTAETNGISGEGDLEYLYGANSQQEQDFRIDALRKSREIKKTLDENGGWGMGADMMSYFTDEVEMGGMLASGLAMGPASPLAAVAKVGSTLQKIRKSSLAIGAIAGTEAAAYEYWRTTNNPHHNVHDVAVAGLATLALATPIAKLGITMSKAAARSSLDLRLASSPDPLSEAETRYFQDVLDIDPVTYQQQIRDVQEDYTRFSMLSEEEQMEELANLANEAYKPKTKEDGDASVGKAWSFNVRGVDILSLGLRDKLSSGFRLGNSENSVLRAMADTLGGHGSNSTVVVNGVKRDVANKMSASKYQHMHMTMNEGQRARVGNAAFDAWFKRNINEPFITELPFMSKKVKAKALFNEEVGLLMRHGGVEPDDAVDILGRRFSEEAKTVATKEFELYETQRLLGVKHKIKGWENLDHSGQTPYMPKIWKNLNIRELVSKEGGETALEELIHKGLTSMARRGGRIADLEAEIFYKKFAKGFTNKIVARATTLNKDARAVMEVEESLDDIIQDILKGHMGLNEKEVAERVKDLFKISEVDPGHKHTKARVEMDDTESVMFNGSPLRITDLLENDYKDVGNGYDFWMGGRVGLAKGGIDNEGGTSFSTILANAEKERAQRGLPLNQLQKEVQAAKFQYDSINGTFQAKSSSYASNDLLDFLRRFRNYGFVRAMGMSGLASTMEAASVLAEQSIPVMLKHLPRTVKLIGDLKSGNLDDKAMQELYAFTGVGHDWVAGVTRSRYDSVGADIRVGEHNNTDMWLDRGRQFVSRFSGLTPVTDGLRRVSIMYYGESFAKAALKYRKGDINSLPYHKSKLLQHGIDVDSGMHKRIYAQMNRHAEGIESGRVSSWNFDSWTDSQARELFRDALYSESHSLVQETSIGSVNALLRGEVGKTLLQFQSFVVGAEEQQLQRYASRLARGDTGTMLRLSLGTAFMGYLVHHTRTYQASAGMGAVEQRKYREKWWSDAGVVEGVAGLAGPLAFYSMLYGRASGTGRFLANPTIDVAESLGATIKSMGDGKLSPHDLRKIQRLLPFQTMLGFKQASNWLAETAANNK